MQPFPFFLKIFQQLFQWSTVARFPAHPLGMSEVSSIQTRAPGWVATKFLHPQGQGPNRGPEVIRANMAVICSITFKLIGRKVAICLKEKGLSVQNDHNFFFSLFVSFCSFSAKAGSSPVFQLAAYDVKKIDKTT